MMIRFLAALVLFFSPALVSAENYRVQCGQVIDSEGGRLLGEHTIVITGGLISEVIAGIESRSSDADVVDLSEYVCLPGLIDSHTHLTNERNARSYMDRFQLNEADYALRAAANAKKTLHAGFTTVRDLGDSYNVTIAVRKAIDSGRISGPRIFTAARSLATTGGHADPTNGYRKDMMGSPGPAMGVVNGVADAREAVRQRYKDGADLIKITATGGVLSLASSGDNAQFMEDELEAIIATANDYGFAVAAHAHGKNGMLRAVNAGVSSIEHGTYMDNDVIRAMKKQGTYLVPTLSAGRYVTEKAKVPGFFPEVVRKKAATIGPLIDRAFTRAYESGVKIAFGTDSGVSAHGENAQEFRYMVELGMPAMEAIQTATVHAAALLRQEASLGQIKAGFAADIIAVDGNPLDAIEALEDIDFVMKGGDVVVTP